MVSEAKLCDSCMCCLLDVMQDKSFWWMEGDSFSRKEQEFMRVCMHEGWQHIFSGHQCVNVDVQKFGSSLKFIYLVRDQQENKAQRFQTEFHSSYAFATILCFQCLAKFWNNLQCYMSKGFIQPRLSLSRGSDLSPEEHLPWDGNVLFTKQWAWGGCYVAAGQEDGCGDNSQMLT